MSTEKQAWTKGPWRYGRDKTLKCWDVLASDDERFAIVVTQVFEAEFKAEDTAKANARLIAQAPAMVEALKAICAEAESWHSVRDHGNLGSVQCDSICALIPKMRAALKSAGAL